MRKISGFVAAFGVGLLLAGCPAPMQVDAGTLSAPAGLSYTPASLTCTLGTACAILGPTNSGGAVATFTITPALPMGLSLDPATGAVSGVATVLAARGNWVITGTNAAGSASVILSIAVIDLAPASLSYAMEPAVYVKGQAITPNTPSSRGGAVESWSVSPALPAGLSLNATTGVIAGTPGVIVPAATYTVTATNSGGTATVALTLTVNDAAPSNLTWATNPAAWTQGVAITPDVPSNSGGAVTSYLVAPALPAGLQLDASTGVITGTPTTLQVSTPYVVTASNSGGSTTATLTISVVAVAPSNLSYATNPANYTLGNAITPNQATVTGTVVSWSVMPALPAGLSLSSTTGVISGMPATLSPSAAYTVTATNSGGSTMTGLTLSVRPPVPVLTTPPVSMAVPLGTRASFSVAATGTGTLAYQWFRGGTALMGATGTSFVTGATSAPDDGSLYTVAVSDGYGSTTTSPAATLTVTPSTFTASGAMAYPRSYFPATLLQNGQVFVAGGSGPTFAANTSAERFNPATGQWTTVTNPMSTGRMLHSGTLLPNGKVLLAGGFNASGGVTVATAEIFDPAAGTFTAAANTMGNNRRSAGAVLLNTGKVLIAGGNDFGNGPMGLILVNQSSADLFDPSTSTFTATGSMTVARGYPTATLLANGKVLVFGGLGTASAEVYDPATGQFTATTGVPTTARYGHVAVLLPSGKVLVAGGNNGGGVKLNTAELFDPATGLFTATAPMNDARDLSTAVLLANGKVMISGGAISSSVVLNTAEIYDPLSNTFVRAAAPMSALRFAHSATLLNTGKVLVAGGQGTINSPFVYEASTDLFW